MNIFLQSHQSESSARPIFVVGTPRSGTTLLASLLCAHSQISGGPETFFFSRLSQVGERTIYRDWPMAAARFLEDLQIEGASVRESFGLTEAAVQRALANRSPSVAAVLEALTGALATFERKARWLEKTPRHLLHLREIRRAFPEAMIVRIVRDPRDVALSLQKVPWASDSLLANLYRCASDFDASREFFERDGKNVTVKYEQLAIDPQQTLERICKAIGVEFESGMLTPASGNNKLVTQNEPWKSKTNQPVDQSRISVWKRDFPHELLRAADMICRDYLTTFDYEYGSVPRKTIAINPWSQRDIMEAEHDIIAGANQGTCYMALCHGNGIVNWNRLRTADDVIFHEAPKLGDRSVERFARSLGIALSLLRRRVQGRPTTLTFPDKPKDQSKAGRICDWMMRLFCDRRELEKPTELEALPRSQSHG